MGDKRNLVGLSRAELEIEIAALGEKTFRANQLWHWIYYRGETDFSRMTTLAKDFRKRLEDTHFVARPTVSQEQISKDSTRKWLMRFDDGQEAESVFIPEDDRGAVCIS